MRRLLREIELEKLFLSIRAALLFRLIWSRPSEGTRCQDATGKCTAASPADPLCQPNAVPCAAGVTPKWALIGLNRAYLR